MIFAKWLKWDGKKKCAVIFFSVIGALVVFNAIQGTEEHQKKQELRGKFFSELSSMKNIECVSCWLVGLNRSEDGETQIIDSLNLENADFSQSDLRGAFLMNSNLKNATLKETTMKEARFDNSDLQFANLIKARLQGAEFRNANLSRANLDNANLGQLRGGLAFTAVREATGSTYGATDFSNANLEGASLRGASLIRTIFSNANLRNSDFREANFSETNFTGADLRGVKISDDQSTKKREMILCRTRISEDKIMNRDC